ncbi:MarR family transcriptional regulator [Amycolatopsis sp. RM579]|uniref:MarR family transcriptional regulator n=2 Tax=Amycolatopsis pithecellobii TaxID=664692 RepID=A0A6N7YWA6_9PSEU|nr:MarR family transcriptional regulator [Amycolatopsis pithecellobii]
MAPAHFSLLMAISRQPGLTGAEMARRLNVTPQAVASLVARLEGKGQLERRPHPRHGHVQELHLTEAGRDALQAAKPVVAEIERKLRRDLGSAEADRLAAMLDRVAEVVKDDRDLPRRTAAAEQP